MTPDLGEGFEVPHDAIVRAALTESGWFEGRSVDVKPFLAALAEEGFSIVDEARPWLVTFGGLTVTPPRRHGAAFASGPILFEPLLAATGEARRISEREQEIGKKLTPVGEWLDEFILLVAADGSVCAETTFQFLLLGRSPSEALRCLIRADRPPIDLEAGL